MNSLIKTILLAIGLTKWYFVESYNLTVTKKPRSKVEYITGVIPNYFKFMRCMYGDLKKHYERKTINKKTEI
jgi:hypothetical protein